MSEAQLIVEKVTLARSDFPWLQDVKTLTLAEAAHRLGDPLAEKQGVTAFLKGQPLLFEPDIALEFWLLQTQERLKADLRWSRRRNGK